MLRKSALLADPNASRFGTRLRTACAKNMPPACFLNACRPLGFQVLLLQLIKKQDSYLIGNCLIFWQGQKDLNPRPAVLETVILPTELYPCVVLCYYNGFLFYCQGFFAVESSLIYRTSQSKWPVLPMALSVRTKPFFS